MKSFAQYLIETRQTFDYRIKILGDCEPELINALEEKLQQFDVVKMTEPKKTPIQKVLADFPDAENDSCTFMDVTFNYPATPPQVTQIAELLGINPNHIIMQQLDYANSVDEEVKGYAEQPNPVLGTEEGEEPESSESKKASEYYAADPYKREVVGNEYSSDFTIAGGKTPPAKLARDPCSAKPTAKPAAAIIAAKDVVSTPSLEITTIINNIFSTQPSKLLKKV